MLRGVVGRLAVCGFCLGRSVIFMSLFSNVSLVRFTFSVSLVRFITFSTLLVLLAVSILFVLALYLLRPFFLTSLISVRGTWTTFPLITFSLTRQFVC